MLVNAKGPSTLARQYDSVEHVPGINRGHTGRVTTRVTNPCTSPPWRAVSRRAEYGEQSNPVLFKAPLRWR